MRTIGYGVIGLGFFGEYHAQVAAALPNVEGGLPFLDEVQRNNVRMTVELIADYVDPPRFYPIIGWAQLHLRDTPVEINRAERHELLRIPGIGPKSAEAILRLRRHGRIRDIRALQRLGVLTARAAPFILLDGTFPVQQLRLF